jgi:hypothetical protein
MRLMTTRIDQNTVDRDCHAAAHNDNENIDINRCRTTSKMVHLALVEPCPAL